VMCGRNKKTPRGVTTAGRFDLKTLLHVQREIIHDE
jgi:hypothetical protein